MKRIIATLLTLYFSSLSLGSGSDTVFYFMTIPPFGEPSNVNEISLYVTKEKYRLIYDKAKRDGHITIQIDGEAAMTLYLSSINTELDFSPLTFYSISETNVIYHLVVDE